MPLESTNAIYEFGSFRLERKEHRLLRAGRPVALARKASDTLCFLLDHHGTLVSKRE